jgi:hypothetical protein
MSNPWHRLRPLPAAPLVLRRRYLAVVPRPFPTALLVVRRRYLILVHWPLTHCASRIFNRGVQADARGATQVLDRGGQAVARGSCLLQVRGRGAHAAACGDVACHRYFIAVPRPLPEKPFLVRRRHLIVVPNPFPEESLAVRRTYLIVVPRPVPRPLHAATRRRRSRRRTLGR